MFRLPFSLLFTLENKFLYTFGHYFSFLICDCSCVIFVHFVRLRSLQGLTDDAILTRLLDNIPAHVAGLIRIQLDHFFVLKGTRVSSVTSRVSCLCDSVVQRHVKLPERHQQTNFGYDAEAGGQCGAAVVAQYYSRFHFCVMSMARSLRPTE